jgi:dihydroorotate dehydrogenase
MTNGGLGTQVRAPLSFPGFPCFSGLGPGLCRWRLPGPDPGLSVHRDAGRGEARPGHATRPVALAIFRDVDHPFVAPSPADTAVSLKDHDYPRTLGDRFLDLVKLVVPNEETRHHMLPQLARTMSILPPSYAPPVALEKTLRFHDRSLPIQIGSPIMLAAGGNKTAAHLPAFAALGFGAVSVGSATLNAWEGNPFRPRVRLLPQDRAMQNSMGLNNPGIEHIAREVDNALGRCHRRKMAVGISVTETPGVSDRDRLLQEIEATFRRAYGAADYIELNLSCPNTGTARLDMDTGLMAELLNHVMTLRKSLVPRKAVFVKLSPDMGVKTLETVLQIVSDAEVTGLVLFNTFPGDKHKFLRMNTPASDIEPLNAKGSRGGVSGRILYQNTLPAVRFIRSRLPHMTLLACGGVDHGAKVLDLLEAGADAVQAYTVLAYRWNAIRAMNRELVAAMRAKGLTSLDGYAPWQK